MDELDDACRAYVAGELSLEGFSARLQAEEVQRANPYLALITEYENSDWDEAELRHRGADQLTAHRGQ